MSEVEKKNDNDNIHLSSTTLPPPPPTTTTLDAQLLTPHPSIQQLLQDLALPSTTSSSSPMLIGHSFGPLSSGLVGPGGSSNVNSNSAVVYRVVLSGGPCGGKTTAMGTITERFQSLGWRVFRVPEAATMLLSGGHSFANLNKLQQYIFQGALLKLMLALEDAFITLARSTHSKCIVLCDRGTMDCRSYMPEDEWDLLLKELGLTTLQLRDGRYDCVLHLVTAADGADKFYTIEGHAARSETPEYARELDSRIKKNWVGHPYFHIIDNSTDFQGKISRLMSTICNFVGLHSLSGTMQKHKFLLRPSSIISFPSTVMTAEFEVTHDYILRTDQYSTTHYQARLRRRGNNGQYTYSYTLRYPDLYGQRLELKRVISKREYSELLLQRDPSRATLTKRRISFLYKDQYYELDIFQHPHTGLALLEFYAVKDKELVLPDFLEIVEEVTHNPSWSMHRLSVLGAEPPIPLKTRSRPNSMSSIEERLQHVGGQANTVLQLIKSTSPKQNNSHTFTTTNNNTTGNNNNNNNNNSHQLSPSKFSSCPSSPLTQPTVSNHIEHIPPP